MKKLSETQMDEIEAVKHYIRYVNSNPLVEDFEIFDAILRLQVIGEKYILNGYEEKDMDSLLELEDMKDLMQKFLARLTKKLNIPND
jgi:hypothetical protein